MGGGAAGPGASLSPAESMDDPASLAVDRYVAFEEATGEA
jgi:hypothetical protein